MPSSKIWDILPQEIPHPKIDSDDFWETYQENATDVSIHIAILSKPYLKSILTGHKTIESRFSLHRRMPYERIKKGDVILLKEVGGFIQGVAYVAEVWFYRLENGTLKHIREKFEESMQIQDEAFWSKCEKMTYATLIRLDNIQSIEPIKFSKRDRNAWATFVPD